MIHLLQQIGRIINAMLEILNNACKMLKEFYLVVLCQPFIFFVRTFIMFFLLAPAMYLSTSGTLIVLGFVLAFIAGFEWYYHWLSKF